ncbi:MAG TPA: VWA domain-containing protein [Pyrinomonadaceae bacterium]|nr:VWA domain-containing protein [Pyrinomonadaceae bacterium]
MLSRSEFSRGYRTLSPLAFLLILAIFVSPTSRALLSAASSQDPAEPVDVLRVSTDLLIFPIRVTNKARKTIPQLSENDFVLTDRDGVSNGFYFAAGAGRIALLFALDESGSLREIISSQRQTALELFNRFKSESRVAAIRFGQRPRLIADFDNDPDAVSRAFSLPPRRNERTAIFDAAQSAVETFARLRSDPTERRIVILISDGLDNASSTKVDSVIRAANQNNVSFYVIHLPLFTPREGRLGIRGPAKGFRDLGEKTGGRYFLASDPKDPLRLDNRVDLSPIFKAIEEDVRSQHLIGFYFNEQGRDGRRHRISISLAPKDLVYSVAGRRFARTHHFEVYFPRVKSEP